MKKIFLLAMLLGLTGCGDNNQSDNQTNTQASTLQVTEVAPTVANYSRAASPLAMSAVAPLQGWNVLSNAALGAETIIEAGKGQLGSIAAIRPNAKQVAEILRGGAAGIALSIAVDQLLGAVDWVMDPANNQIKYHVPIEPNQIPQSWCLASVGCFDSIQEAAIRALIYNNTLYPKDPYLAQRYTTSVSGKTLTVQLYNKDNRLINIFTFGFVNNPNYNPNKTLSLEIVAEKVIMNADEGSLDAQVATNIAAQNILNDEELAKPVVIELEENAKYAGVAPRPNDITHDRENQILNMRPNDPCDEISEAIKDLEETIQWRKDDLNPAQKGQRVYVNHQKRIRILNDKKDEMNRAYKVWCEGK